MRKTRTFANQDRGDIGPHSTGVEGQSGQARPVQGKLREGPAGNLELGFRGPQPDN